MAPPGRQPWAAQADYGGNRQDRRGFKIWDWLGLLARCLKQGPRRVLEGQSLIEASNGQITLVKIRRGWAAFVVFEKPVTGFEPATY